MKITKYILLATTCLVIGAIAGGLFVGRYTSRIANTDMVASEIPQWHVIKDTARGTQMFKIVEATSEYGAKFIKRPPNLITLVTKGILKEEDLCLKNLDGSLAVPDYYPDPAPNVLSETVVIRAPSEYGSYQIVVRKDLSIGGVANKKPAEQAGTGQPATRPESKSEGIDKPQPEAEGRSR